MWAVRHTHAWTLIIYVPLDHQWSHGASENTAGGDSLTFRATLPSEYAVAFVSLISVCFVFCFCCFQEKNGTCGVKWNEYEDKKDQTLKGKHNNKKKKAYWNVPEGGVAAAIYHHSSPLPFRTCLISQKGKLSSQTQSTTLYPTLLPQLLKPRLITSLRLKFFFNPL